MCLHSHLSKHTSIGGAKWEKLIKALPKKKRNIPHIKPQVVQSVSVSLSTLINPPSVMGGGGGGGMVLSVAS